MTPGLTGHPRNRLSLSEDVAPAGRRTGQDRIYQSSGTTNHGPQPAEAHQRWRSMFIDEIDVNTAGLEKSIRNYLRQRHMLMPRCGDVLSLSGEESGVPAVGCRYSRHSLYS